MFVGKCAGLSEGRSVDRVEIRNGTLKKRVLSALTCLNAGNIRGLWAVGCGLWAPVNISGLR